MKYVAAAGIALNYADKIVKYIEAECNEINGRTGTKFGASHESEVNESLRKAKVQYFNSKVVWV